MSKPTAEAIEAAAAAIGLEMVNWTYHYRPNVHWPDSYSENERAKFRNAAIAALIAAPQPTPATGWRTDMENAPARCDVWVKHTYASYSRREVNARRGANGKWFDNAGNPLDFSWIEEGDSQPITSKVTHWQPLPSPPPSAEKEGE